MTGLSLTKNDGTSIAITGGSFDGTLKILTLNTSGTLAAGTPSPLATAGPARSGRREQQLSGHGRDPAATTARLEKPSTWAVWAMASCCAPMAALTTSSGSNFNDTLVVGGGADTVDGGGGADNIHVTETTRRGYRQAVDQQWPEHAARLRPGLWL
ncbi:MAG: hypothetical protein IPL73_25310 [Candidatus Obscuribacter sp.]|nr:hypothetical protein [Candidatus Obscuribacter sp.]